ncbi:DNA repair protein RAD16 [Cryptotrichosporon argae]
MSIAAQRRHIPYLNYHKAIIREICRPQKDDLLIIAKGLGMRRIVCALLKTYDRKEDLVIVVNASPSDEAGIGDELGIMGVRDPGFRVLTYEMTVQQREDLYRHGGIFSVTSKILVNDLLKETVPAKLITGLVILHAEKVSHGSQEEFAVRLFRRENQSGFCKAFSDEPEVFAHGMSPLRDMLINLNMTNSMIWPRYNEAVKVSLATRTAEVVEMYQPMTDLMRRCQDSITECMEAMLVELKRDHSLNLDLEDLNVRNAQFKSFDTIVRMRLKPVWHKVGAKTKVHVAAMTELRNLQTWLLEYDSATFASYINTLQRQHYNAEKLTSGPGRHLHDWFNAKAAATLVEASQLRVSRPAIRIEGSASTMPPDGETHRESNTTTNGQTARDEYADEMDALHELEERRDRPVGGAPIVVDDDEGADEVMLEFATQTQTVPQNEDLADDETGDDVEDTLNEVTDAPAPPVFKPLTFSLDEDLSKRVQSRVRKGHEPVLEEQPKWSLLARILKEIEDTIARVAESHVDQPGTNIVLVMTSSDRTCLQLRQYLTTMQKTDPPFGARAGRKMMETLFLSNWQHEKNGERLANPSRMDGARGGDEVKTSKGGMEEKLEEAGRRRGIPAYKRRRRRAGAPESMGRYGNGNKESDKLARLKAHSAFAFDGSDVSENVQMQWALGASAQAAPNRPAPTRLVNSDSNEDDDDDLVPVNATGSTSTSARPPSVMPIVTDASSSLLARAGIIEEADLASHFQAFLRERGLMEEDWEEYGLLAPEDSVIIRPYGGEDDDILLQELRPRFVVMYEPNLAFIRRLEVYKNCNPGLALRVYQLTYTNSFEEDRFLATVSREAEAFKKLIEDRAGMVIPIYNNNPRAPMRDNVSRSRTTYSTRNAGGGDAAEDARIVVDIREMGALLPSLIDAAGIKVVPATLTVGDYILTPKMCVERKALPDLEQSLANGRLHTQCEAMTSHYETCILLIEFEEDRFGLRTKEDARREQAGRGGAEDGWADTFYLQSKLALLALHFPRLRIIWSSSPHESVRILSDLKLNHPEPDEAGAILKGSSDDVSTGAEHASGVENAGAVEMLRAIPGINGGNVRYVMGKVESIKELVAMSKVQLESVLGEDNGAKAYRFIHHDVRNGRGYVA